VWRGAASLLPRASSLPLAPIVLLQRPACGLKQFAPARVGQAVLYEALQDFDWYDQQNKSEFHVAAALVQHGHSVFEVGCGRGSFASQRSAGVRAVLLGDFVIRPAGVFDVVGAWRRLVCRR
jgi:hypothetical protein